MSSDDGGGADGARGGEAADACDTCDSCGQSSTKTKQCSGCKTTRYCDAACQKSHWPVHGQMCRQIQNESKARRRELGEALLEASARGQLSEVRGLLAAGADPRYEMEEGKFKGLFPLIVASQMGHIDVM